MVGSLAFPQAESPAQWYSFGCLPVPGAANRVETSLAKEAADRLKPPMWQRTER